MKASSLRRKLTLVIAFTFFFQGIVPVLPTIISEVQAAAEDVQQQAETNTSAKTSSNASSQPSEQKSKEISSSQATTDSESSVTNSRATSESSRASESSQTEQSSSSASSKKSKSSEDSKNSQAENSSQISEQSKSSTTSKSSSAANKTSIWSYNKTNKEAALNVDLVEDKEYVAPQNEHVRITFTKLPETAGSLTIREVRLTPKQQELSGADSDIAYEFLSDMQNGTFEYDLTLPKPTAVTEAEVKYAANTNSLDKAQAVSQTREIADKTVTVRGLDHFTVFIVADPNPVGNGNQGNSDCSAAGIDGTCYDTIQAAIDAADPNDSDGIDQINITAGTYNEDVHIDKAVNISGTGIGSTIINTTGQPGHCNPASGVCIEADNVNFSGLTIEADQQRALQITDHDNITVEDVELTSSNGLGLDVINANNIVLRNITAKDNAQAGIFIKNINGLIFEDISTSNNGWGNAAIGISTDCGTCDIQNITFTGSNSIQGIVYLETQQGNSLPTFGFSPSDDIQLQSSFGQYAVGGTTKSGSPKQKILFGSLSNATTFATDPGHPHIADDTKYIEEVDTNNLHVASGMDIQDAIDNAESGNIVNIANGTYTECIDISNQNNLTVQGESEASTIIDASGCDGYGFDVNGSSNINILELTLEGPSAVKNTTYGFKISDSINISLENITAQNSNRTNIDFNGVDTLDLNNITATNAANGNGVTLTDTDNVNINNVYTQNNAWGAFALYSYGAYYPEGTDNINFNGDIVFNENLGLYLQEVNNNGQISNVSLDGANSSSSTSNYLISNGSTNDISALNVNWGTSDLDDIESKLIHDCENSPYLTGTCNGNNGVTVLGNDLPSNYGSIEYAEENTAPTVNIAAPNDGGIVNETFTVTTQATDDYGMGSYYIRLWQDAPYAYNGGKLIDECFEAQGADNLGTNLEIDCDFDSTTNPDDTYYVTAQFLDSFTEWGSDSIEVVFDNTSPAIQDVDMLVNGIPSRYVTEGDSVKITVDAEDVNGMDNSGNYYNRTWSASVANNWAAANPDHIASGELVYNSANDKFEYTFTMPAQYQNGDDITTGFEDQYFNGRVYDEAGNSTWFPFQRYTYYDLDTPNILGWNLRSESENAYDLPADLQCGDSTNGDIDLYGDARAAHQVEYTGQKAVGTTDVLLQRNVTWPTGASGMYSGYMQNPESSDNYYTNFVRFGSAEGTEGVWTTQARAFIDLNGNNNYDSGEPTSDWSENCDITLNATAPELELGDTSTTEGAATVPAPSSITNPEGLTITYSGVDTADLTLDPNVASATVTRTGEVTDAAGNTTTATYDITINNNPVGSAIAAAPGTTVTEGTAIDLTAIPSGGDAAYAYTWTGDCPNTGAATTSLAADTAPGDYVCGLTITDADGDTDSSSVALTVNSAGDVQGAIGQAGDEEATPENEEDIQEEEQGNIAGEQVIASALQCEVTTAISGYVYIDANDNDTREEGETGLDGVSVEIYSDDTLITTVITNEEGYWEQQLCAGEYEVRIVEDTLPEDVEVSQTTLGVSVDTADADTEPEAIEGLNFSAQQIEEGINWLLYLGIGVIIIVLAGTGIYLWNRRNNELIDMKD